MTTNQSDLAQIVVVILLSPANAGPAFSKAQLLRENR